MKITDFVFLPEGDLDIFSMVSKIWFCAWASSEDVYIAELDFIISLQE